MPKAYTCPNCQAPLRADPRRASITCEYCGYDVKQTIAVPSVLRPPRQPITPPREVVVQMPEVGRSVRRWIWISVALTVLPGVLIAVCTTWTAHTITKGAQGVGNSLRGGLGKASDPDAQLSAKLRVYAECLSRNSTSVQRARDRYQNWRAAGAEPSCRESCVSWGVSQIYLNRGSGGCLAEVQKARTAPPGLPALEAAGDRLTGALDAIATVADEGHRYYDEKDYKDDACAKGRALHPKLVAGFAAYFAAEQEVRGILDKELPALQQRLLERAQRDDPQGFLAPYLKTVMECRRLLDVLRGMAEGTGSDGDAKGVRAMIASIETNLDQAVRAEQDHPLTDRISHPLFPYTVGGQVKGAVLELLKAAKELARESRRAIRKRSSSGHGHEHPLAPAVSAYNRLIGYAKGAGPEAIEPPDTYRCR